MTITSETSNDKKRRIVTVCKYSISIKKSDTNTLERIGEILTKINNKDKGRQLTVSDIFIYMITKITDDDIGNIQINSLTAEDLAEIELENYNTIHSSNLTMAELFLLKLKNTSNNNSKSSKKGNNATFSVQ